MTKQMAPGGPCTCWKFANPSCPVHGSGNGLFVLCVLAALGCGGREAAGPCGELGNACCETTAWSASGEPGRVCMAGLQCMDLDQTDDGAGATCLYHCGALGEVCCNSDPSVGFACSEGLMCVDVPSAEAVEAYPGVYVANHCVTP